MREARAQFEEALRLKGDSDTEVVAVSLGPQKALDSLRKALAMGADRAVLVSDDAAAGSPPPSLPFSQWRAVAM